MRSRLLYGLAMALSVVGAINWGSFVLFRVNLLSRLLGGFPMAERIAQVAVGLAGVWLGAASVLPRVALALRVRIEDPMQTLVNRSLVGRVMPSLTGTTLSGWKVTIPGDTEGKITFLAMGFSYDSRFEVEDWMQAFQERFGREPEILAYEMAIIDWPYRLFGGPINEGMRRGTPSESHDRVITLYASQRPLRQTLRAAATSDTWVYLLDTEGRVLFQCSGPFDSERFLELSWVADSALARARTPMPETAMGG